MTFFRALKVIIATIVFWILFVPACFIVGLGATVDVFMEWLAGLAEIDLEK